MTVRPRVRDHQRLDALCIGFLTLCFVFWFVASYPSAAAFVEDPDGAYQMAGGQQILWGEHPFLYFRESYGPLVFYASALVNHLSNGRVIGELLLLVVGFLAGYLILFRLLRTIGLGALESVFHVLVAMLLIPRLYKYYIVLFPLLGVLVLWWYLRAPTRGRLLAVAVVIAVTGLFRPDFGVYLFLTVLCSIALRTQETVALRAREAGLLSLQVLLAALPWLAWVTVQGGLYAYLRDSSVGAMSTAMELALPMPAFDTTKGLADIDNLKAVFFRSLLVVPLLAAAQLYRSRGQIGSVFWLYGLSLAVFSQLCIFQALHRSDWGHWLQALPVPLVCLLWSVFSFRTTHGGWTARLTVLALVALLALLASVNNSQRWPSFGLAGITEKVRVLSLDNAAILEAAIAGQPPSVLAQAIRYMGSASAPDQRIAALPAMPNVNSLAQRRFAGGQMAILPGYFSSPDDQQRFVDLAMQEDVAFVLMLPGVAIDGDPARLLERFAPRIMDYLHNHFQVDRTFGPYIVYRRRNTTNSEDPNSPERKALRSQRHRASNSELTPAGGMATSE